MSQHPPPTQFLSWLQLAPHDQLIRATSCLIHSKAPLAFAWVSLPHLPTTQFLHLHLFLTIPSSFLTTHRLFTTLAEHLLPLEQLVWQALYSLSGCGLVLDELSNPFCANQSRLIIRQSFLHILSFAKLPLELKVLQRVRVFGQSIHS